MNEWVNEWMGEWVKEISKERKIVYNFSHLTIEFRKRNAHVLFKGYRTRQTVGGGLFCHPEFSILIFTGHRTRPTEKSDLQKRCDSFHFSRLFCQKWNMNYQLRDCRSKAMSLLQKSPPLTVHRLPVACGDVTGLFIFFINFYFIVRHVRAAGRPSHNLTP